MSISASQVLDAASEIASGLAGVSGPAGIVAGVAAVAFKAASKFAQAGKNPVIEITQILAPFTGVAAVDEHWTTELTKKFGAPK